MPVLTQYWFEKTDFRGQTDYLSIGHGAGGWAWINWSNIGSRRSTLAWEREDRETVHDPALFLNLASSLDAIDQGLGSQARRSSQVYVGWIPWRYVPYRGSNPGAHGDLDLFLRIWFRFHADTPWFCSDADGNISYYAVPYLDGAGNLGIYIDGWSYKYDGGGPFCTGAISDKLDSGVPGGIAKLQDGLNSIALLIALGRRFDGLNLLPGLGERSGSHAANVDEQVVIAVLPR
jgi:hypothetical protein